MDSPRSSNTSDHLAPPSPYPATVDPSPVDSNGTNHTDHTEVHAAAAARCELAGLTPPQIEDDEQENQVGEDNMSDIRSPATDDIVSPTSPDVRAKVGPVRCSFMRASV
jgi:LmbE family N-acetylglucosaminyl deacetylase